MPAVRNHLRFRAQNLMFGTRDGVLFKRNSYMDAFLLGFFFS